MVSIAISFLVMIVAVAISSGFRSEIRSGVSSLSGDVQITSADLNYIGEDDPIQASPSFLPELETWSCVERVVPAVYRAGIVRAGENIHGVLFKGVPGGGDSLRVSVPSGLAELLDLSAGDRLTGYFIGDRVRMRNFTVGSIYPGVLSADENVMLFAGIGDMQRLNGWAADEVSALEVMLRESYRRPKDIRGVGESIGSLIWSSEEDDLVAIASTDKYPQLFSWLDLIDSNVLIILILMTIVAGFNMISGLLILLFRNISTIGILKSMGMTDRSVSELFLRVSSTLVLKGMLTGNLIAFILIFIQGKTHLVGLNPENYFVSFVPVSIPVFGVVAADVLAYLVIMLLLQIPCLFITRVDPAVTVRTM